MRFIKFSLPLLFLFSYYANAIDCNPPDCTKEKIKKGVVWYHKKYSSLFGGPQNVNILDIDFNDPHITIKPVYKYSSSCERTSSMGDRTGALAGINGGFFNSSTGCSPLGLLKIDNKVISYAVSYKPPRSALGISSDREIIFRRTDSKDPFPEAIHALGGMPNLVKNGSIYLTTKEEEAESIDGKNPRTAICKTSSNHFMMIVVDGRDSSRVGMTLQELAQYLLWLGCSDGINLDGGGSTTMWIKDRGVVNYPSDGSERYVSNGLFIYYTDNLPPEIFHNPISESEKTDIVINAIVKDDYGVKAVNLKFRNKGESSFTSRPMINSGEDNFVTTIYKDEIKADKIEYYIAAWDGEKRSLLPYDAESSGHYFIINILNPVDAGPDISEYDTTGYDVSSNEITDASEQDSLTDTGSTDITDTLMEDISKDSVIDEDITIDTYIGDTNTIDTYTSDTITGDNEVLSDVSDISDSGFDIYTADEGNDSIYPYDSSQSDTRSFQEDSIFNRPAEEESETGCSCTSIE